MSVGQSVAWVPCPDCGGRGWLRHWLIFLRQCWRCGGDGIVPPNSDAFVERTRA